MTFFLPFRNLYFLIMVITIIYYLYVKTKKEKERNPLDLNLLKLKCEMTDLHGHQVLGFKDGKTLQKCEISIFFLH